MTRPGPGLFERITGHFADGTAITDYPPEEQTFYSVRDNVQRILNSRRKALAHLPDYGLDDLSEIYRHLPASAHRLKTEIEATLLEYEPRLRAIDIEINKPEPGMLLSFTMACHLRREGLVRFGTDFTPDGRTRLRMLQQAPIGIESRANNIRRKYGKNDGFERESDHYRRPRAGRR